jgi:CRISPR-associated protein Csb2
LAERERPFQFGSRRLCSLQFQTIRHDGGGNRGNGSGNAFTIIFPEPVSGPLALGYGSHFSLGLFQPIMNLRAEQLDDGSSNASVGNPSKL